MPNINQWTSTTQAAQGGTFYWCTHRPINATCKRATRVLACERNPFLHGIIQLTAFLQSLSWAQQAMTALYTTLSGRILCAVIASNISSAWCTKGNKRKLLIHIKFWHRGFFQKRDKLVCRRKWKLQEAFVHVLGTWFFAENAREVEHGDTLDHGCVTCSESNRSLSTSCSRSNRSLFQHLVLDRTDQCVVVLESKKAKNPSSPHTPVDNTCLSGTKRCIPCTLPG